MNPQNQKLIREAILSAAENLKGKLPDHPRHPDGRNPYAHIPKVIKDVTGYSYKDLPDELCNDVMDIIKHCEENPF